MSELYDLNLERSLLSSIVFDNETKALHDLRASDFYLPFHGYVFDACLALYRKEYPIDESFLQKELKDKFDEVAMVEILAANPISNPTPYIKQIKDYAQKRDLLNLATLIKKSVIEDGKDALGVIDFAIKRAEQVAEGGAFGIARESIANIEKKETEFYLKEWLPIPRATLSMIVAPGGTGKTWIALQMALRLAKEGVRSFLWLSEDPQGEVKGRYEAVANDFVGYEKRLDSFIDISTDDPVLLLESKGYSASLSSRFYALKRELREYDVIFIDPLLAFYGGDENDNSQARIFMQAFLNWARGEDKSIIFVHHSKKGERLNASGARGAGAIVDAVRCVYDMDKIYTNSGGERVLDERKLHMRKITLTKDNYGASRYFGGFVAERVITPQRSAREYQIEFEYDSAEMPRI